ncbi:hypothetical protein [Shewanella sp.]|uniref:hypothetical protein n=1 Tax=Shewanella sp. TaxID=50422 RepID=UPI003A9763B8
MTRTDASEVAAWLQQLVDLLEGEPNWQRQFRQALGQYQRGNHSAAAKTINSTAGSMGSANDVALAATPQLNMAERNQQYHHVLAQLYQWSSQQG